MKHQSHNRAIIGQILIFAQVTGKTHEERVEERRLRAIEEQRQYEAHQAFRRAMAKAIETGEPQLVGKDRDGKNIYIEPPNTGGPV